MRLRIALLTFCLGLAPVFAADKPVTDDALSDQVRLRLANDTEIGARNIEVLVHDGAVTLKGKVRSGKQRDKAVKLTKKVKGVHNVVNDLVVSQE